MRESFVLDNASRFAIIMIALVEKGESLMTQLLVRNLDPNVVDRLKKRARSSGRSLQAEAKSILEEAASFDVEKIRRDLSRLRRSFRGRRFPDSAELIREDRDR